MAGILGRRRRGGRTAAATPSSCSAFPSGPLLDPAGLLARGGALVEGVVIAPFQLGLDVSVPYGEPAEAGGLVAGLLVAAAAEGPLGRSR